MKAKTKYPKRATWGRFAKQTVHRHPGKLGEPYVIRQDDNRITVFDDEIPSLIIALLRVKEKTR